MRESDWLSAHAFYHDDLDRLLLGAVAPLVERLQTGWFYLRYWDGGPHVRLRVRSGAGVRELVEDCFARHFAADPARGQLSEGEYLHSAAELAGLERMGKYADRLYPNNSVVFIPYRRELDRYGDGPAIEAVEHHFFQSSRIALGIVAGVPAPRRTDAACAMLLLAWFSVESELDGLLARNRMIADRYPATAPAPDHLGWAADLARRMRVLAGRVTEITGNGALLEWARATATLRDSLADCGTPPRKAAEVIDDCAHLLCNRLGIPIQTEGRLRGLAAAALEPVIT